MTQQKRSRRRGRVRCSRLPSVSGTLAWAESSQEHFEPSISNESNSEKCYDYHFCPSFHQDQCGSRWPRGAPSLQPAKIATTTTARLEKSKATCVTPGVGIRPRKIATTPKTFPTAPIEATRVSELTDCVRCKAGGRPRSTHKSVTTQ